MFDFVIKKIPTALALEATCHERAITDYWYRPACYNWIHKFSSNFLLILVDENWKIYYLFWCNDKNGTFHLIRHETSASSEKLKSLKN